MFAALRKIASWPARLPARSRVTPLGLSLISASASALLYGWMSQHHYFARDVYGDEFLILSFMLAAAGFGAVFRCNGMLTAVSYLLALTVIGTGIQVMLTFFLFPMWAIPGLIFTAGLCGATAFFLIAPSIHAPLIGAASEVIGFGLLWCIATASDHIWPMRLVWLTSGAFAWMVCVGPVMGLSMGLPAQMIWQPPRRLKATANKRWAG